MALRCCSVVILSLIIVVPVSRVHGQAVGVTLSLNGEMIANDSFVNVHDIGEDDDALLCTTNQNDCCNRQPKRDGEWYFSGTPVGLKGEPATDNNFYRNRGDKVVRLNRRGSPSEIGQFSCVVPDANDVEQTVFINVVDIGNLIISQVDPTTTIAGKNFTLECSVDISPYYDPEDIIFNWFFGPSNSSLPSNVIMSAVTYSSNIYTSTIEFSPLSLSHSGLYTCRLWQKESWAQITTISVECLGICIGFERIAYHVMEGNNLSICLEIEGNTITTEVAVVEVLTMQDTAIEAVDFSLINEDVLIHASSEVCINITTSFDSNLMNMDKQFSILLSSSDSKVVITPDKAIASVVIENIPPPKVEPMRSSVSAGNSTTFIVSPTFNATAYRWQLNGVNIIGDQSLTSNLTIYNVSEKDEGNYTCMITTIFGVNILSKIAQLFVFSPANITDHPSSMRVPQGDLTTASFSVKATGEGLSYQWQRNNTNLQLNNTKIEGVYTMTLTVNNVQVEDAGTYRCVITNGAGDSVTSNEATLTVVTPPLPPIIMGATFESNIINISLNNDAMVVSYKIQYNYTILNCDNDLDSVHYESPVIDAGNNTFLVINSSVNAVEENSNYTIMVIAANSAGESEPTTIINVTQSIVPSEGPLSISSNTINATSITIQWERVTCDERNGEITGYNIIYYPNMLRSVNISGVVETNRTFVARGLLPRTSYTFEVGAINSVGVGPATKETFTTTVPEEVGFFLNGTLYSNNSIVNLEEIGVDNSALICLTNSLNCCNDTFNGDWYDPDNMTVTQNRDDNTTDYYYYTSNGPSMVRLNKIDNAANGQGVFRCTIPDASGNNQRIFVGIYSSGMGIPNSANLTFNVPTLTCTSTGGPATTVTWKKNGQDLNMDGAAYEQNKVITDTQTAEYKSTLILPKTNIIDFNSEYECIVENVRGYSNASLTLQALKIIENDTFILGKPAALTCTSVISDELVWLGHEGIVLVNVSSKNTSIMSADLTFNQVNDSIHNKTFTCRAELKGTVEKDIFVSVSAPEPLNVINVTINTSQNEPVITVGEQFNMTCVVHILKGFTQQATVVWRHPNGTEVSNSLIEFNRVHASDDGNYTCTGMLISPLFDTPRQTREIVTLKIKLPPPAISFNPLTGTLYAGSSVNITYTVVLIDEVDIDVFVKVTCHYGGENVVNDDLNMISKSFSTSSNAFTSFFTLFPLSARDNIISCSANISPVNDMIFVLDSLSETSTLNLSIANPNISVNIRPSSEGNLSVGNQLNIACVALSFDYLNAEVAFLWKKNNVLINISSQTNEISISSIRLSDADEYTCEVNVTSDYLVNGYATGMGNYNLSIRIPSPTVNVTVMKPMDNIFIGSNFTLDCTITVNNDLAMAGTVEVSVKWSGPIEIETSTEQLSNKSAEIVQYSSKRMFNSVTPNHSGNYVCEANLTITNSSHLFPSLSSSDTVRIDIVSAPSAPNITSLLPLNSTTVEIEWAKGDIMDEVYEVTIQYMYQGPCSCSREKKEQCGWKTFVSGASNNTKQYIISSLQEHSAYTFKVKVSNPVRSSAPTEKNVTTLPSAPSGSPQFLNVTASSLTSLTIKWSGVECFERNSDITGYIINLLKTSDTDSSIEKTFNVSDDEFVKEVTELFPSTMYTFQVAAIGNGSIGPFNNITGSTSSPKEVGLLLNGELLKNNSIVTWMDIGEGSGSLFCITNNTECCEEDGSYGWKLPNGNSALCSEESEVTITQHYGRQSVRIERQCEGLTNTGVYQCDITDANGTRQHIYIGIYNNVINITLARITFMLIDPISVKFSLNCIFEGRPVNQIFWMINGSVIDDSNMFPILSSATSGRYYNVLALNGRRVGTYSCHVTDEHESIISEANHVVAESQTLSEVHGVELYGSTKYICWNPVSVYSSSYRVFTVNSASTIDQETAVNANHSHILSQSDGNVYIQVESLSTSPSTDFLPSDRLRVTIKKPAVELIFKTSMKENNSIIEISDVGKSSNTIACVTDKRPCCMSRIGRDGEWYYPNNSIVPNIAKGWNFYQSRNDEGSIFLHHAIDSNATGRYCCHVPDKNCGGLNHTLCVQLVSLGAIVTSGSSIAGKEYNLTCLASNTGAMFRWFGPNGTLISDSASNSELEVIDQTKESTLHFRVLKEFHNGEYMCTVTLETQQGSSTSTINVQDPIINVNVATSGIVSIGQNYSLSCNVLGAEEILPVITYQWIKNNIGSQTNDTVGTNSSFFSLYHLNLSDAGTFTCIVIIDSIFLMHQLIHHNSIELHINMPNPVDLQLSTLSQPIFLPKGINKDVDLTSTVTLNPRVNIPVTATVTWSGHNFSRENISSLFGSDTMSYNITVAIHSVNIEHAGKYNCSMTILAENNSFIMGAGTIADSINITLFEINLTSNKSSSVVGSNAILQCDVVTRGTEEIPVIFWNGPVGKTNDTSKSSIHQLGSLRASNAGTYICHASFKSSTGSESINLIAALDMELKLNVSTSEPVKAGDTVNIICSARIDRSLVDVGIDVVVHLVSPWGQNASEESQNDELGVYNRSFTLDNITGLQSGLFICNATISPLSANRYLTSASRNKTLDLILVPSRPAVMIVNTQDVSVSVSWSQASGDRVEYYLIDLMYQGRCNIDPIMQYSENTTMLNTTINGLHEFSDYLIVVTAVNTRGRQNTSRSFTTLSSVPTGIPQNIWGNVSSSTSIQLKWNNVNCLERNGNITGYIIQYESNEYINSSLLAETAINYFTASNLIPLTSYVFKVAAVNVNGTGPSNTTQITTKAVEGVKLFHNGEYHKNNSIVTMNEIGEGKSALLCFTNKQDCCRPLQTNNMHLGQWYLPNGSLVRRDDSDDILYRDRYDSVVRLNRRNNKTVSAGVYRCEIPDRNETNQSLFVGIYPLAMDIGVPRIQQFEFDPNEQAVVCVSVDGPATDVFWSRNEVALTIDENEYQQIQIIANESESLYTNVLNIRKSDLADVAGNYTCSVSNSRGHVNQSIVIKDIWVTGHESALPHGSSISLNCTTDLAVDKIEWLNTEGSILETGNDSILELIVTDTDTEGVKYTCRITSAFGNQTKNITLKVLSEPASSSVISSAVSAIVVAIVMAVLVTVLIIIVFVIVRRKRQGRLVFFSSKVKSKPHPGLVVLSGPLHGNEDDVIDNDKIEMKTFGKGKLDTYRGGVVSITDFGKHVKKMHDDRDEPFETEYASISKDPQNSYAIADIVVNRFKNRFANIFPYDYNRVKLKDLAGAENSNYINASYVDGYEKPKGYIAAQGPLPNTLEDYWRMVWENRLTTIVMLTQCFEGRKKCECYWPENINCTFEAGQGIEIILTSMTPFAEYTVRKMTVTKSTEPNVPPLEVVQFHFLAWPDHGVPNNCAVMLNFVRRVRKLHPYSNPCPLLVHCSAGVGRTGTFIVLDSMLEKMKTEDTLDVYDFVNKLRTQRVLMVQSLAQYIFIHDALKEVISCGQTEIPAADMRMVINQLNMQSDPCSASTGFEHQFQVLCQMPCETEDNCYSNATSEHNKPKNRYHNRLPNNFYRVRMKSTAIPGSDYINASFIDGYRQKNTYIATQGPLESTVCDFWRMVWEKESKCVVLLSKLMEEDKEKCFRYWPSTVGNVQRYGQITVKMLSEDNYGDYNLRKFEINEDKTGVVGVKTAFTVTQFHFLVWPEHETPPITSSLIELMDDVNKVQMRSGNRPMIVMCNDGVGRTGTFISIHAQLERLKTEGVVDFFQFVKSARMHRAGLVSDVTQYILCHDVVANYLDSFDTYANFKEVV